MVAHTLLIPPLQRQKQAEVYEFKARLLYIMSSRLASKNLSQKKWIIT